MKSISAYIIIFCNVLILVLGDIAISAKAILIAIFVVLVVERISKVIELEREIDNLKKIIQSIEK